MLRSLQNFPADGWKFFQPEINWNSQPWMDFNNVVQQIIAVRQANPRFNLSVDREQVAAQLVAYTEARLRSQYGSGADQWILPGDSGGAPPDFITPRRRQPGVGAAAQVDKPKKPSVSLGVVTSWLGNGLKPAPQVDADRRASICATCEFNKEPNLLQAGYALIAKELHELMETKAEMNLRTPHDSFLKTCSLCDCSLPLKVWVDKKEVQEHTKPELLSKLPSWCWVKSESELKSH